MGGIKKYNDSIIISQQRKKLSKKEMIALHEASKPIWDRIDKMILNHLRQQDLGGSKEDE